MISTTKASEEREMAGETWEVFQNEENKNKTKQNAILVGSLQLLVSLPQTKLLIYTTSSKPSKKVPLKKTYREETEKTFTTTTRAGEGEGRGGG